MPKTERRADQRAFRTKAAVKDAMLALLGRTEFEKITVASLCREAGIGRATFYTHYDRLTDVLDELGDDAIQATESGPENQWAGIAALALLMRSSENPEELSPYMNLLPVCHRVADHPKYRALFRDRMVSERLLAQIYSREKGRNIADMTRDYGLTEEQADKLFLFALTGAFAVNRSMNWKKDETWYGVQKVLLTFLSGGHDALERLRKPTGKQADSEPE